MCLLMAGKLSAKKSHSGKFVQPLMTHRWECHDLHTRFFHFFFLHSFHFYQVLHLRSCDGFILAQVLNLSYVRVWNDERWSQKVTLSANNVRWRSTSGFVRNKARWNQRSFSDENQGSKKIKLSKCLKISVILRRALSISLGKNDALMKKKRVGSFYH